MTVAVGHYDLARNLIDMRYHRPSLIDTMTLNISQNGGQHRWARNLGLAMVVPDTDNEWRGMEPDFVHEHARVTRWALQSENYQVSIIPWYVSKRVTCSWSFQTGRYIEALGIRHASLTSISRGESPRLPADRRF